MILVIDNYDSFTYNLVHYLNELGAETLVQRNDALSVQEALGLKPAGVLLSPGPCTPNEAGICLPLLWATRRSARPMAARWCAPRP
jgi:anthranilate synthase component II